MTPFRQKCIAKKGKEIALLIIRQILLVCMQRPYPQGWMLHPGQGLNFHGEAVRMGAHFYSLDV